MAGDPATWHREVSARRWVSAIAPTPAYCHRLKFSDSLFGRTQIDTHLKPFRRRDFWNKLKRSARKAGKTLVYHALQLFYAAQRPETPKWAKGVIYGALAYFINPLDAVPDALPGGFVDDLSVLAGAVAMVALHITPDVSRQARNTLSEWFGPDDDEVIE